MPLSISQSELQSVCTALALISGGFNHRRSLLSETERLFGCGGLAAMHTTFDKYKDGLGDLWRETSDGLLVVTVSELWFPERDIQTLE